MRRLPVSSTLQLIDDGLHIYRMAFSRFILVTAIWCVPVFIVVALIIAAFYYSHTDWFLVTLLFFPVAAVPLFNYLVTSISRVTMAVQRDDAIRLRSVLAFSPLRITSMGCFSVVFYIIVNIIVSTLSMMCVCPMFWGLGFLFSSISEAFSDPGFIETSLFVLAIMIIFIMSILLYAVSLAFTGTTYSSLVYALQPFIQENIPFGKAIERSINLIFYQFGKNLLTFMLTSIILVALSLVVTIAIGVLLPLPLWWVLGEESTVAQAVSSIAWLLGLLVVLPPMPIWMTLLYQRNTQYYDGHDLQERMAIVLPTPATPQPATPDSVGTC